MLAGKRDSAITNSPTRSSAMVWAVDPAAVMAAGARVASALAGARAIQCVRLFFPSGFTLFPMWGQQAVLTRLTAVIQFIESPLFV
jgi:hypothetical protein